MADTGEQNEPMMSGSMAAGDDEKTDGIIEQTAADLAGQDVETILAALIQRFSESDVDYDESDLRTAAERISSAS